MSNLPKHSDPKQVSPRSCCSLINLHPLISVVIFYKREWYLCVNFLFESKVEGIFSQLPIKTTATPNVRQNWVVFFFMLASNCSYVLLCWLCALTMSLAILNFPARGIDVRFRFMNKPFEKKDHIICFGISRVCALGRILRKKSRRLIPGLQKKKTAKQACHDVFLMHVSWTPNGMELLSFSSLILTRQIEVLSGSYRGREGDEF